MLYLLLFKIKKGNSEEKNKIVNPPKKKEDIIKKNKNKDKYAHILDTNNSETKKRKKDKKKDEKKDKKKDEKKDKKDKKKDKKKEEKKDKKKDKKKDEKKDKKKDEKKDKKKDKKKDEIKDEKNNSSKSNNNCLIISKNTKVTQKNVKINVKGKNKIGMQVLINSIKKSKEYLIDLKSDKYSSQNLNNLLISKKLDKSKNFNYSLINSDIDIKKYLEPISEFNDYDEVIEEDNRTFCEYYKERIADNQMIISTFFVSEDIKPKSIKIAIFILTIDLYILLNGLFYSDSYISRVFNSTEKETFFSFIPRSIDRFIYSTMAGNIIEYIIKFLIVEEITIHKLLFKKRDTKRSLKYDMSGLLKSILNKIKVLIIISYIIIIFSWYYISCFNNAYPNIKIEWIISSIFIIIFIQILPFIFCFFETCLRFLSIKIKSEKLFKLP